MGNTTAEHTPTPWITDDTRNGIFGADGQNVVQFSSFDFNRRKVDRELIVTAVNSYGTLQSEKAALSEVIIKDTEQIGKLQADNAEQQKRIAELEEGILKIQQQVTPVYEVGESPEPAFIRLIVIEKITRSLLNTGVTG